MPIPERLSAALRDRYRIERELGAGGMATVYVADDLKHQRKVAVKVLREDLAAAVGEKRFRREIEIAAGLTHPNILPVHDSGTAGGFLYYVMPYIAGESLREKLSREGALPIAEVTRILRELTDALAKAHKAGVVHRDLKPENILLSDDHALVMDFGIARAVSDASSNSTLTQAGVAVGTPAYMAPEQASGDPHIDARADIYALGVVAYEMLAGRAPFTGATAQQVLAAHVSATPDAVTAHRQAIPAPLAKLVMSCLHKHPADRPQTAAEIVRQLDTIRTPDGSAVVAGGGASALNTPARRRWFVAGGVVLAALGAIQAYRTVHRGAGTMPRSIVVLPFENASRDTSSAYFADVAGDELRDELGNIPGLNVTPKASSIAVKGLSPSETGGRLRVDAILVTSMNRSGLRLHVNSELIRTTDGSRIWYTTIDRETKDLYEVQDTITHAIASALRLTLGGTPLAATQAHRTVSAAARDQYFLGRHAIEPLTEASLRRAIAHFDSAIVIDSGYALAYAGKAEAWWWLGDEFVAPDSSYPRAREAALQAMHYDSTLADAHALLATSIASLDRDMTHADLEFHRAIDLDPNSVVEYEYYANILSLAHPGPECLAPANRAVALDPESAFASWVRAACLYSARRYDETIAQDKRTAELDPGFMFFDAYAGASYREQRKYPQAIAAYRKAQLNSPRKALFGLGVTFARMGLRDSALRVVDDLKTFSRSRYLAPATIGMIYANLGEKTDKDSAFAWLRRNEDVHSIVAFMLIAGPEFDPIRADPRYQPLLARVKPK